MQNLTSSSMTTSATSMLSSVLVSSTSVEMLLLPSPVVQLTSSMVGEIFSIILGSYLSSVLYVTWFTYICLLHNVNCAMSPIIGYCILSCTASLLISPEFIILLLRCSICLS